jgi:hypothetical protein
MTRILTTLNRRLDVVYQEMEIAWAIYQQDRRNDGKLCRYIASLRRANRLWTTIKSLTA